MIICPVCKESLIKYNKQYKCTNNHSFDIAKQGYTNLLINQSSKIKGDSKEMLHARNNIQEALFYEPLLKEILSVLPSVDNILDIGCGTGYYTRHFKGNVIGIDIAKDALKIAARNDKFSTYIVASNKELPVKDKSIDLVINIFAPIYLEEVLRVLNDGYIVVVSPNENHLIELKGVIYDSIIKKEELRNELDLECVTTKNVVYKKELQKSELHDLFLMTPHYWTSTISGKERISNLSSLEITFDFNIKVYKKTTN